MFSPTEWMNVHLNMPGLEIEWLYDDSKPNYRISALDYFEYPEQLIERIYSYGEATMGTGDSTIPGRRMII